MAGPIFAFFLYLNTLRVKHGPSQARTEVIAIGAVQIRQRLRLGAWKKYINHHGSRWLAFERRCRVVLRTDRGMEPVPKPVPRIPSVGTSGNQENLIGGIGPIRERGRIPVCLGVEL